MICGVCSASSSSIICGWSLGESCERDWLYQVSRVPLWFNKCRSGDLPLWQQSLPKSDIRKHRRSQSRFLRPPLGKLVVPRPVFHFDQSRQLVRPIISVSYSPTLVEKTPSIPASLYSASFCFCSIFRFPPLRWASERPPLFWGPALGSFSASLSMVVLFSSQCSAFRGRPTKLSSTAFFFPVPHPPDSPFLRCYLAFCWWRSWSVDLPLPGRLRGLF